MFLQLLVLLLISFAFCLLLLLCGYVLNINMPKAKSLLFSLFYFMWKSLQHGNFDPFVWPESTADLRLIDRISGVLYTFMGRSSGMRFFHSTNFQTPITVRMAASVLHIAPIFNEIFTEMCGCCCYFFNLNNKL